MPGPESDPLNTSADHPVATAIGIDLGGTDIKYALVRMDGEVLFSSFRPTESDSGKDHILQNILGAADEAAQFASENGYEVAGAGIGTPGIVDQGVVLGGAENLRGWEQVPLADALQAHLGIPAFVDNDANLLGLAEARYGKAKGDTDVIFITVGTGIGGAMILNGKLYGGHRNRGAEMGHVIVNAGGEPCPCGAVGCLEAHASIPALIREYKKFFPADAAEALENIDGRHIVEKYQAGDPAAVAAMDQHFDYLAAGIAGFINIFSPEKVIIGGGISESGDFYVEQIRSRTLDLAMKECSVFTDIERAGLGNAGGYMGAASLVWDNLDSKEHA